MSSITIDITFPSWYDFFTRDQACRVVNDLFKRDHACRVVNDLFTRDQACRVVNNLLQEIMLAALYCKRSFYKRSSLPRCKRSLTNDQACRVVNNLFTRDQACRVVNSGRWPWRAHQPKGDCGAGADESGGLGHGAYFIKGVHEVGLCACVLGVCERSEMCSDPKEDMIQGLIRGGWMQWLSRQ
jgi:hypothetical protein